MNALVTGASGYIGGAIARTLLARGVHVRALLRPDAAPNVADPRMLEIVRGDLRDASAVRAAAAGCDAIFHAGALSSLHAPPAELHLVNVGGTRHVVQAARAIGARLVLTSSQHATGRAPGPYEQTKWRAEQLVLALARERELDAVIVHPTFPVGWGDVKPTPTGAIIRDFLAGKLPAYVDTRLNVIDVDDVAAGHWLAFERGRSGERYLLGHANLRMHELLRLIALLSGRRMPRLRLPHPLAVVLGVRTAREVGFATSARAVRELGLPQTPIAIAISKAVRWFEQATARGARARRSRP